jgi:hypothetical protein
MRSLSPAGQAVFENAMNPAEFTAYHGPALERNEAGMTLPG